MMQAASDIFLGWTKGVEADRYLYWRQLRDMKGSAVIETMAPRRSRSTRGSAAGRWRGPTPDRATRSPSPRTSARRTGSTGRSPTSPSATPTRTSGTTRPSPTRSGPAGSRRSRGSDLRSGTTDGRRPTSVARRSPTSARPRTRRGRHPSCRVSGAPRWWAMAGTGARGEGPTCGMQTMTFGPAAPPRDGRRSSGATRSPGCHQGGGRTSAPGRARSGREEST